MTSSNMKFHGSKLLDMIIYRYVAITSLAFSVKYGNYKNAMIEDAYRLLTHENQMWQ
jgi:hypothetical protein